MRGKLLHSILLAAASCAALAACQSPMKTPPASDAAGAVDVTYALKRDAGFRRMCCCSLAVRFVSMCPSLARRVPERARAAASNGTTA